MRPVQQPRSLSTLKHLDATDPNGGLSRERHIGE
jgi:hypothetical protein